MNWKFNESRRINVNVRYFFLFCIFFCRIKIFNFYKFQHSTVLRDKDWDSRFEIPIDGFSIHNFDIATNDRQLFIEERLQNFDFLSLKVFFFKFHLFKNFNDSKQDVHHHHHQQQHHKIKISKISCCNIHQHFLNHHAMFIVKCFFSFKVFLKWRFK